MRTLLPLLLLACAPEPLTDAAEVFGPEVAPDAELPPPTSITLEGPEFVMAGRDIHLDVSGALPEEDVFLAVGAEPGEGPCRAWLGGYCLGVSRPVGLAARDVADGDGAVHFVDGAGPWPGATYCYQAVIRRGPMGIASAFSDVVCVEHCSIADDDDDGVCNEFDVCPGGRDDLDSDGDGVCDALDLCPGEVGEPDSDGDGVCDGEDLCPGDDFADSDGDGVCDGLDECPGDDFADSDGDGICDGLDEPDVAFPGSLNDFDVADDGRMARTWVSDGNAYIDCYDGSGGVIAEGVLAGTNARNWAGPIAVWNRPGNRLLVVWYTEDAHNKYQMFDGSCRAVGGVGTAFAPGNEWFDAAVADDGSAVIVNTISGVTKVARLNSSGGLTRTDDAFDDADYGTHVALDPDSGAGIVSSQTHSGDGIYYRRWNAGDSWMEGDSVRMATGNYHYWYDGHTVGMNDTGDFVFLWRSDGDQIDMAFYNSGGARVANVNRATPDFEGWDGGHCYDSFRRRHQEIPLRGSNFILGEVYNWIAGGGQTVEHWEYTPGGGHVRTGSTDISVGEGLTIRLDGAGDAYVHDERGVYGLGYYP